MRFAVVGDPVDHSLSPAMHTAALRHVGLTALFDRLRVPAAGFEDVVRALRSGQLDGISVTMPHKRHAFEAADECSPQAARCGAVNTLIADGSMLHGFNTDIDGVQHALDLLDLPDSTPVLVVGAGGAAAASLVALDNRPLIVTARNTDSATQLLGTIGIDAEVLPWGEARSDCVIVNATPLGMKGERLPPSLLQGAKGVVDMAYRSEPTPLVAEALRRGLPVADGIDMLAGQAVAAFSLFTGHSVPIAVMESAARRGFPSPR